MEKISKVGKNFDETLEELLNDNNLKKEEVIYTTGETKKSLFKGEQVEVIVYKKSDIYASIKDFFVKIPN